jgi:hypothetical protein
MLAELKNFPHLSGEILLFPKNIKMQALSQNQNEGMTITIPKIKADHF